MRQTVTSRAISRENLEIVRRFVDAFNRRDTERFAAMTTADFEWTTSMMAVEGEVFWGRQAWDKFRGFADECRDLGDRVLRLGHLEGRGRASGVPVGMPLDILFDFRGEKISRMHSYLDHAEALRAAGLAE